MDVSVIGIYCSSCDLRVWKGEYAMCGGSDGEIGDRRIAGLISRLIPEIPLSEASVHCRQAKNERGNKRGGICTLGRRSSFIKPIFFPQVLQPQSIHANCIQACTPCSELWVKPIFPLGTQNPRNLLPLPTIPPSPTVHNPHTHM